MSGISTKGVKKSYISKELKPGNCVAKINSLSIEQSKTPKDPKNPEYKIWIELESKPLGGEFVGFDKVFGDPSKGQYLGQTKKIQFSNWPIKNSDGISKKTGKAYNIEASTKILEFVQKLLSEVGGENWLEDNDGKFNTWDQLFSGVIRSGLLKDKYFSWLLAGTESENAAGYTVYYMYLPEKRFASEPFAIEGGLVTTFDPAVHITKSKKIAENAALNGGVDDEEDDSVFDTSGAPTDDPFADDADLFEMD